LEYAFDANLKGKNGSRSEMIDRLGRVVEEIGVQEEVKDGDTLRLTIDMRLQYPIFQMLKGAIKYYGAKAGMVMVMDAKTGDVLAMVNWPSFVPGQPIRSLEQLKNRVVTDAFEPGSTFKPFTIALALDQGKVKPGFRVDTSPGKLVIADKTIRDAEVHGVLDVSEVIQKSSNIGTSKIAFMLDSKDMWGMYSNLGFGRTPKVGLSGEASGILMKPEKWLPIHQATISYGHGVSVSALQLVSSYTVFANDGVFIPPRLVLSNPASAGHLVFSPRTAKTVLGFLEKATQPGGTGTLAGSYTQGYRMAGKSGTSKKLEGGKYVKKYVTSFSGVVPASKPQYVITVVIDEPSKNGFSGGIVAAPLFSRVAQTVLRVYNVIPDAPEKITEAPAAPAKELVD
jgi:cell division protein FtsI (penicillin-binding protein 3)